MFKIPSPQELAEETAIDLSPRVEAAVKRIVGEMKKKHYQRGEVSVHLENKEFEIGEMICREFAATGKWSAQIRDCQRDGTRIVLTPFYPGSAYDR